MHTITVPIDEGQAAQIDTLRARQADLDDAAFWQIVLGDGLDLYRFQLDLDEAGEAEAQRRAREATLPDRPGATRLLPIVVTDDQVAALDALRARRPAWDDAYFWRQAIMWGVGLLTERLDDEDSPRDRPDEATPGDDEDMPF